MARIFNFAQKFISEVVYQNDNFSYHSTSKILGLKPL